MTKKLDPMVDLDKRQRLALRQALANGGMSSAPSHHVTKLEKLGLVARTGHYHEPQEWGKVVRREPMFYLTPVGEEVAQAIVAALSKPINGAGASVPQGKCFSWAFSTLPEDGLLVHATVHDPWSGKPFQHAWIEIADRVYDWQSVEQGLGPGKSGWSKKAFYEAYQPANIKEYRPETAYIQALRFKHSGPW